jgi:ClpP class serine protease
LDLGLVDELMSSDDFLFRQRERATILEMTIEWRKSLGEKMAENFSILTERALSRWQQKPEGPCCSA